MLRDLAPEAKNETQTKEIAVNLLQAWIFSMMVVLLDPSAKARARRVDVYDIWADYADTALCLADVVSSEESLFVGEKGKAKTAALLLSIARSETGFTNDISGDGGRSHCMMAIMTGRKGRVLEGTSEELLSDKRLCFRAGLRVARLSFRVCSRNPLLDRLSVYASGSCSRGHNESRKRMREAIRLWQWAPPEYVFEDSLTAELVAD